MSANGVLRDSAVKPEQHKPDRVRRFFTSTPGLAIIYFGAITIAESTTVLIEPRIGLILHGCVLITILLHSALLARGTQQDFLFSLILAPLLRLLSLSLPLASFQVVYWYAMIGTPLLVSVLLTARLIGLSRTQIGLTLKGFPVQLLFGLVGIGLGTIEYYILRPTPLTESLSINEIWLPAIILLIFTGLLEEIIFRGVMYYVSLRSLGRSGIFYVAAIFAVLHLGQKSIIDVIFIFGVALLFGIFALRTGSILGVTLAHGIANIVLFLILPFAISPTMLSNPTHTSKIPSQVDAFSSTNAYTQSPPEASQRLVATPSPEIASPRITNLPMNTITQAPMITQSSFTPTLTFTPLLLNRAVVDDGDLEFIRSGGEEQISQQGYGGDFVWTTSTDENATTQVEWRPTLTVCGIYKVEVFIPSWINLTQTAFYQVSYRQGMTSLLIDQSAFMASWVSLGEYEFLPTNGSFLRLTNYTGESAQRDSAIVFDAARWTLVGSCKSVQP